MSSRPDPSDALVFFGATGDLAHKMIFPALQVLVQSGRLDVLAGHGVAEEALVRGHGGGSVTLVDVRTGLSGVPVRGGIR
jgi:hypothetical protein